MPTMLGWPPLKFFLDPPMATAIDQTMQLETSSTQHFFTKRSFRKTKMARLAWLTFNISDGGAALLASALGSIIFQKTWHINNYFVVLNYNSCMQMRACTRDHSLVINFHA